MTPREKAQLKQQQKLCKHETVDFYIINNPTTGEYGYIEICLECNYVTDMEMP